MRKRVVDEIRELIRKHAEKKGYAIVLDSTDAGGSAAVLYHRESIDITEDVLKMLKESRETDGS